MLHLGELLLEGVFQPFLFLSTRFQFITFCLKSHSCTSVGRPAQLANLMSRAFWGMSGKSSFLTKGTWANLKWNSSGRQITKSKIM